MVNTCQQHPSSLPRQLWHHDSAIYHSLGTSDCVDSTTCLVCGHTAMLACCMAVSTDSFGCLLHRECTVKRLQYLNISMASSETHRHPDWCSQNNIITAQRAMKVLSQSCSHADCSDCLYIWMPAAWRVHYEVCWAPEFIDGMMRNLLQPRLAFPK